MEHPHATVNLSELPDQPIYNVKAVCVRTGISSATLRAWERRYGVPSPNRSSQGYRLYSERDMAILHWLVQETNKGVNIGHAVQAFAELLTTGQDLSIMIPAHHAAQGDYSPRSPTTLATELVDAYHKLSERRCNDLIAEALALYTLETTIFLIVRGSLAILRKDAERQPSSAAIENFALNHMRQRLDRILQATPIHHPKQGAMLIGFANEGSEIDLIMLAILLRRAGHDTIYMVANFDADLLRTEVTALRVKVILFYSHHIDNAVILSSLSELSKPGEDGMATTLLYAGLAPRIMPSLREIVPFEYLGDDLRTIYRELLGRLRQLDAIETHKV